MLVMFQFELISCFIATRTTVFILPLIEKWKFMNNLAIFRISLIVPFEKFYVFSFLFYTGLNSESDSYYEKPFPSADSSSF